MAFRPVLVPLLLVALSASLNSCASSGDRVTKQLLVAEYHPQCRMDFECKPGFICMYIDANDPNGYCEVETTRGFENYPCIDDSNCARRRGLQCIYSSGFSDHGHCLYPAGVVPGIPN